VALEVEGDEASPHEVALASLPLHFSPVEAGRTADIRVVAGTPGTWTALAETALRQEPRAVVVASRASAAQRDASRLAERATSAGIVVVTATPFAGDRTWRAAQGRIRAEASSASVVDSVMVWATAHEEAATRALLDQLAVVRGIVSDISGLRVTSIAPDRYLVAGAAAGMAVLLSGTRCKVEAPRLLIDMAGTSSRWRACFDGAAPARPTVIERHSEDRIDTQPFRFESGYRAIWIDLYEHLVHGVAVPDYLSIDERQLAMAGRLAAATRADVERPSMTGGR
jgi:hypothetical protein